MILSSSHPEISVLYYKTLSSTSEIELKTSIMYIRLWKIFGYCMWDC